MTGSFISSFSWISPGCVSCAFSRISPGCVSCESVSSYRSIVFQELFSYQISTSLQSLPGFPHPTNAPALRPLGIDGWQGREDLSLTVTAPLKQRKKCGPDEQNVRETFSDTKVESGFSDSLCFDSRRLLKAAALWPLRLTGVIVSPPLGTATASDTPNSFHEELLERRTLRTLLDLCRLQGNVQALSSTCAGYWQ